MHFSCIWVKFISNLKSYFSFHRIVYSKQVYLSDKN